MPTPQFRIRTLLISIAFLALVLTVAIQTIRLQRTAARLQRTAASEQMLRTAAERLRADAEQRASSPKSTLGELLGELRLPSMNCRLNSIPPGKSVNRD